MRSRALLAAALLAAAVLASACASRRTRGVAQAPGLGNFAKVDEGLWRCAQPSPAGFAEAARLGARTVLTLRAAHPDTAAVAGTGLGVASVPMRQWHVDEDAVVAALKVATDPALRPVLVHCQEGRDRTGLVVAAYRVLVQGWSREDAVAEMGAYGNHPLWANQRRWVRSFDLDRLRARVAAAPAPVVERP